MTTAPSASDPQPRFRRDRRIVDALSWLAVLLAAFAAASGLLVPGLYRDVPAWVQQAQGADVATLLLAVPLSVLGMWAAARGSVAGRLVAIAVLLYLAYTYAVSAFSVAINPFTVIYIAVLGLAAWAALLSWAGVSRSAVERLVDERLPRMATGAFLLAIAVLFGLLWLGQLATVATTGQPPAELTRLRLPTNPIYALDLAFFLPACAVAGLGLLRRLHVRALAVPLLVFTTLIGAEILGGFLFAVSAGDDIPVPVAIVLGAITLAAAALSWHALGASLELGDTTGSAATD